MNSLRDDVKDAIRSNLANYYNADVMDIDADLVADIADSVFDVIGISDDDQDKITKKPCYLKLT